MTYSPLSIFVTSLGTVCRCAENGEGKWGGAKRHPFPLGKGLGVRSIENPKFEIVNYMSLLCSKAVESTESHGSGGIFTFALTRA